MAAGASSVNSHQLPVVSEFYTNSSTSPSTYELYVQYHTGNGTDINSSGHGQTMMYILEFVN